MQEAPLDVNARKIRENALGKAAWMRKLQPHV